MSGIEKPGVKQLSKPQTTAETDWFAKLRAQDVDAGMDEDFRDWLDQDPQHERDYEQCELIWELAGELEDEPELTEYLDDCEQLIADKTPVASVFWVQWRKPMAIAASFVAIAITILFVTQAPTAETYMTAVGEQRLIRLPDSSTVVLNTDTQLSVSYSESERRIDLNRGEALFSVIKDPKPFNVYAANGKAQAVGTRFNVRLRDKGATVSVLEGIVQVEAAQSPEADKSAPVSRLTEGEAVNYWRDGGLSNVQVADVVRIEAWRAGKLNFDATRLADVVAEHNRYTAKKIIVGDDELNELLVSGVFRVGESEPLIFALENVFNISAIDQGRVTILLAGKRAR